MGTISLTIPVAGSTQFSTAAANVDTDLQTIQTTINGGIDGANLDPTLPGRRLIGQAAAFLGASAGGSGFYFFAADGTLAPSGTLGSKAIVWWYLDPTNFSVTNRAAQAIVRMSLAVGGSAPALTFAGQLSVVSFSGSGGQINPSIGTIQGTAASIASPASNSVNVAECSGGAFTFPNAGAYAPAVQLNGTSAASSATSILWQLFLLNT